MSINTALYSRLSSFAGLFALVGNRIYPVLIPESAQLPAVAYSLISTPEIHAMNADPTINGPRYQISCRSATFSSAEDVAEQVKLALKDYSGTVEGIVIQRIFYKDEKHFDEPDTKTFHIAIDFIVWYEG